MKKKNKDKIIELLDENKTVTEEDVTEDPEAVVKEIARQEGDDGDSAADKDDDNKDDSKNNRGSGESGEPAADNSDEDDEPSYTPGKKKGKKKWIILGVIAALVVLFLFMRGRQGNVLPTVHVEEASRGDIEETVTISGTVASSEKKTYFAVVSAEVASLLVEVGDRVKKGELLLDYDENELALTKRTAELNLDQANGNYSGTLEKNAKSTDVLRGNSTHDINNRLDEITAEIDELNYKITEKTDRMSQTLTELQQVANDINQNGIADSYEAAYTAQWNDQHDGDASVNNDYITRLQNGEGDSNVYANEENQQMLLAVQQNIIGYQNALQHDDEIEAWQRQITALNEEQAKLNEQKSVEASKLTSGDKTALEAQRELTELNSDDTISDVEDAEDGVRADFAGVITEISIEEGMTVAKGTRLISIASTDDVEVDIQISKADMTRVQVGQAVDITVNGVSYDGEVTQISGSASKNASGVPVVDAKIKIKNPDENLILGVEASNKIHTNKAEGVIVLPYEYIGSDSAGDFVYIFEDGTVKRRDVIVGLTTSTLAEVTDGLSGGELIVTDDTETITDGMAAVKAE